MGHFRCFFKPDVCQLHSRHIGKFADATEHEIIFWPNCSKFAVECDWNSKISQNVPILGLFLQKNMKVFEIPKSGKFTVECVSNGIIS